jgi:arylformamidase
LKDMELVDLSSLLHPGEEERRLEIRHFKHPEHGTHMHEIDIMSHIGAHIEAPYHYFYPEGKDITDLPLDTFLGECIKIDLTHLSSRKPITPQDLETSTQYDVTEKIVLLQGPEMEEPPYLTKESAEWLVDRDVKMLGIGSTIGLERRIGGHDVHITCLENELPLLENLINLERVQERCFLVALPLNIKGLESGLTRAVAIHGLL